jgi:hypothetical protein
LPHTLFLIFKYLAVGMKMVAFPFIVRRNDKLLVALHSLVGLRFNNCNFGATCLFVCVCNTVSRIYISNAAKFIGKPFTNNHMHDFILSTRTKIKFHAVQIYISMRNMMLLPLLIRSCIINIVINR